MLFTLTTTYIPATDLGYLLHKRPGRTQTFELNFGQAHVFYPEATPVRCTAALLLDINPVSLVLGQGQVGHPLGRGAGHQVRYRQAAAEQGEVRMSFQVGKG